MRLVDPGERLAGRREDVQRADPGAGLVGRREVVGDVSMVMRKCAG